MTFYRDFCHRLISFLREKGIKTPLFVGGPYPTGDFENVLKDRNIDLCSLGEGEVTITELVKEMMKNGNKLPKQEVLKEIPGLAFVEEKKVSKLSFSELSKNSGVESLNI